LKVANSALAANHSLQWTALTVRCWAHVTPEPSSANERTIYTARKLNTERKMDPEKIMNGISREILSALNAMEKAKTAEEKLVYSEAVKNLCDSLGVFLNLIGDMEPYDDDGEPIPF
jgi:hypothetical protein